MSRGFVVFRFFMFWLGFSQTLFADRLIRRSQPHELAPKAKLLESVVGRWIQEYPSSPSDSFLQTSLSSQVNPIVLSIRRSGFGSSEHFPQERLQLVVTGTKINSTQIRDAPREVILGEMQDTAPSEIADNAWMEFCWIEHTNKEQLQRSKEFFLRIMGPSGYRETLRFVLLSPDVLELYFLGKTTKHEAPPTTDTTHYAAYNRVSPLSCVPKLTDLRL